MWKNVEKIFDNFFCEYNKKSSRRQRLRRKEPRISTEEECVCVDQKEEEENIYFLNRKKSENRPWSRWIYSKLCIACVCVKVQRQF